MLKPPRSSTFLPPDDTLFAIKPRKIIPHEFVLDALAPLSPETRPMFGCLAVYVEDKIVLALRNKCTETADNGVWLATSEEHHESLRGEFPNLRSIQVFGKEVTSWQVLAADTPDFEEAALRACELIAAGDPRIGKVPKRRAAGVQKNRNSGERMSRKKSAARDRTRF
ncbi:MAG: hypothetical protein ACJ73N_04170 [Bryobacteraceae bacterium]